MPKSVSGISIRETATKGDIAMPKVAGMVSAILVGIAVRWVERSLGYHPTEVERSALIESVTIGLTLGGGYFGHWLVGRWRNPANVSSTNVVVSTRR